MVRSHCVIASQPTHEVHDGPGERVARALRHSQGANARYWVDGEGHVSIIIVIISSSSIIVVIIAIVGATATLLFGPLFGQKAAQPHGLTAPTHHVVVAEALGVPALTVIQLIVPGLRPAKGRHYMRFTARGIAGARKTQNCLPPPPPRTRMVSSLQTPRYLFLYEARKMHLASVGLQVRQRSTALSGARARPEWQARSE